MFRSRLILGLVDTVVMTILMSSVLIRIQIIVRNADVFIITASADMMTWKIN